MTGLLKKTGEQIISIFAEAEDDQDQETEEMYSAWIRLSEELKAEKASAEHREKALSVQHAADMQAISDEFLTVKSEQDRVKDKLTFLREEASLLEDQIKRAEQLRTELMNTLQSPDAVEQMPEDESLEFYKSEVMTSRQVQANLKSVIHADELLTDDAARQKEFVLESLQSKESEIEKALSVRSERSRKWAEDMREVQGEIERLKGGRMEADEKDLQEVLLSQKRTLDTLKSDTNALVIQLESRRTPARHRAQLPSSQLTDLDFLQVHPALYKTAAFLDEMLLDLRIAMDDFAVVKLVLVVYLVILHLWVLLSTLGVSAGC